MEEIRLINNKNYHKLSVTEICDKLNVDKNYGLTTDQIAIHRQQYGLNKVELNMITTEYLCHFLCDYQMGCIYITMITLILCIIGVSLAFNIALLLFTITLFISVIISIIWLKYVTNKFAMIKREHLFYTPPTVSVIRNDIKTSLLIQGYIHDYNSINIGNDITNLIIKYCTIQLKTEELVPGDIVTLKTGDIITADIRLIECSNDFTVNEAPLFRLTGQHGGIHKNAKISADDERIRANNLVFDGCNVINGEAKGIVFATGDNTEFGRFIKTLQYDQPDVVDLTYVAIVAFQRRLSCFICLMSITFLYLLLVFNGNDNNVFIIGLLWCIFGIITILISGFIIYLLWKSKENLINDIKNDCNMLIKYNGDIIICDPYKNNTDIFINGVKGREINKTLELLGYDRLRALVIDSKYIKMENINSIITDIRDLNIKLVIIQNGVIINNDISTNIDMIDTVSLNGMDRPIYITDDILDEQIIFKDIVFSKGIDTNDLIRNLQQEGFPKYRNSPKLNYRNYNNLAPHDINIHNMMNRFIVCYIGDNISGLRCSNIGIALNEYSTDIAKEAADIICCCSSSKNNHNAHLNSIIKAIKIARKFKASFGYKLRGKLLPKTITG